MKKKKSYKDIFGWFDFEDIYDRIFEEMPSNGWFVEIGAFFGKSTCYMGELLRKNNKFHFATIDTFEGSDEPIHKEILSKLGKSLFEVFQDNCKACGLEINAIVDTSINGLMQFPNGLIDTVFLDGSHEYEDVLNDIKLAKFKVKKGGIIAGHDIDFPQVWRAVKESFKEFEYINRSWIVRNI